MTYHGGDVTVDELVEVLAIYYWNTLPYLDPVTNESIASGWHITKNEGYARARWEDLPTEYREDLQRQMRA